MDDSSSEPMTNNSSSSSSTTPQSVSYENRTELYRLIGNRQFEHAHALCSLDPSQVSTWITTDFQSPTIWYKRLPIHLACERKPPPKLLRSLLSAHPTGVTSRDENGKIPLIHACCRGASLESIRELVRHDPETVKWCDDTEKKLPIHWACDYGASLEVLQELIGAYPDGLKRKDKFGRLPLHWLCVSLNGSITAVDLLLERYAEARDVADGDGFTPIDLAKGSDLSEDMDKVVELLEKKKGS